MRNHLLFAFLAACATTTQPIKETPMTTTPAATTTAVPANYSTTRTGDVHDFDFIEGAWNTTQRRLKARGVGSNDWDEFPATVCARLHLGGLVNVDEVLFPTKGWAGLTIRSFDVEKRQWAVYWINSRTGRMFPPVHGGFEGDRGELYGEDDDDGRPVKVRYMWIKQGRDRARWEQAFSYDGGPWETNWVADFMRADPATVCDQGRPKR